MKQAAISIVQRPSDQRYLVVWNKRYGGWGFPGGMVEEGETIEQAQARELLEETGIHTKKAVRVYEADVQGKPNRASHVVMFAVTPNHYLGREMEDGCAVTYMTKDEILEWSPFREWYRKAIEAFEALFIGASS